MIFVLKRVVFYKREPSKQIIMKRHKERFVIDLTYLPLELIANTNCKYLFNIMDHFSKFIISFLIENKNANTIVEKLKFCFDNYGATNQIGCDNGTEFINKKVKK